MFQALGRVDEIVAAMRRLVVADAVEDEELEFRPEEGGVGDAGRFHEIDGFAGHVAGVARVVFLGERVLDVADHRQGGVFAERVEKGRVRHGDHEHVRFVDGHPAADRRAVEAEPLLKGAFAERLRRHGKVLPQAWEIHEAEIDRLDFFFRESKQELLWVSRAKTSWKKYPWETRACLVQWEEEAWSPVARYEVLGAVGSGWRLH